MVMCSGKKGRVISTVGLQDGENDHMNIDTAAKIKRLVS